MILGPPGLRPGNPNPQAEEGIYTEIKSEINILI